MKEAKKRLILADEAMAMVKAENPEGTGRELRKALLSMYKEKVIDMRVLIAAFEDTRAHDSADIEPKRLFTKIDATTEKMRDHLIGGPDHGHCYDELRRLWEQVLYAENAFE